MALKSQAKRSRIRLRPVNRTLTSRKVTFYDKEKAAAEGARILMMLVRKISASKFNMDKPEEILAETPT